MHDRLPTVSWLVPTSYQSEHPDYTPAAGADFVASKIDAIAANPDVWAKTVFILNYDENDGLFDHVLPPTAPAGTRAGEYVNGAAHRRRLPGAVHHRLAVDAGGWIASETFDHTSVLQFLEQLTGVTMPEHHAPGGGPTFGDLTSAFGFPVNAPFPRLPDTKAAAGPGRLGGQHPARAADPRRPTRRRRSSRPGRGPARAVPPRDGARPATGAEEMLT